MKKQIFSVIALSVVSILSTVSAKPPMSMTGYGDADWDGGVVTTDNEMDDRVLFKQMFTLRYRFAMEEYKQYQELKRNGYGEGTLNNFACEALASHGLFYNRMIETSIAPEYDPWIDPPRNQVKDILLMINDYEKMADPICGLSSIPPL